MADEIERPEDSEQCSRIQRAVQNYADSFPLDLLKAGEIQRDLWSIAGAPHFHRNSIGSDACLVCQRDLRDEIHFQHGY